MLSAIRPTSLKELLESNLAFSHHLLQKDFKSFLQHAIKLAEEFQLVDCGPPSSMRRSTDDLKNGPETVKRPMMRIDKESRASRAESRSTRNPVKIMKKHRYAFGNRTNVRASGTDEGLP